jgi:hypothetical protein
MQYVSDTILSILVYFRIKTPKILQKRDTLHPSSQSFLFGVPIADIRYFVAMIIVV